MSTPRRAAPSPRIGELLLERGLITPEALQHALALQRAILEERRTAPKIGEILVREGALDRRTIREILEDQRIARGEKSVLDVRISPRNGVVLVHLRGRLDPRTDERLARVLDRLLAAGARNLVLVAQRLLHADPTALATLIVYLDEFRLRGGDLKIAAPSAAVRVAFERIHLDRYVDILRTSDEAERAFTSSSAAARAPTGLSEYSAGSRARYYHRGFCPDARRIDEETRTYFRTARDAIRSGKLPCPKCIGSEGVE
jgi:anti-anti-sigma factor